MSDCEFKKECDETYGRSASNEPRCHTEDCPEHKFAILVWNKTIEDALDVIRSEKNPPHTRYHIGIGELKALKMEESQ